MASTPRNRGDGKRKKSPTSNKEGETLEEKEERLMSGLLDSIATINSLVDRHGPYKNTANEVKNKLRELQKLCGRVMDVRRMKAEKKEGESERTPKRAKKAVTVEERGTNTSTGGEMEGLEWDDDLGTETDWKEVERKGKRQRRKEKNRLEERERSSKVKEQVNVKGKSLKKDIPVKMKNNPDTPHILIRTGKKKEKRKSLMAKPEALLVEVKDRDYASVLKEVKSGLASEEVVFSKVRKTRRGDLLLELEKGQDKGATQIREKVAGLCPTLTMRALKDSANVIIKGLDIIVEREEVEESLKQKVKDFRIKNFWENKYGNKTVIVELPKEEAQKLVEERKIKIGWMRVSVELMVEKRRCYRCLEYGHISTRCPGQDRSKKCYNCGGDGHKARECNKETTCAICNDKGQHNKNHRMGSKNCPSWRKPVPGKRYTDPKNPV